MGLVTLQPPSASSQNIFGGRWALSRLFCRALLQKRPIISRRWALSRYSRRLRLLRFQPFQFETFEKLRIPSAKVTLTVWYTTRSFCMWETKRAVGERKRHCNTFHFLLYSLRMGLPQVAFPIHKMIMWYHTVYLYMGTPTSYERT